MSDKLWATPRNYSFNQSHRPGLTTLDCQVRGLYPDKERYHGVSTDSNQLMLFAEAFPASRIPLLADVPAPTTSATCGPTSSDSFASLLPDGSWRKTCQGYSQVMLDGSLERFSETWPRAGMTRNGIAYRRAPLAPLTDATECGSWPTPNVPNGGRKPKGGMSRTGMTPDGKKRQVGLENAVMMWPTPCAEDAKNVPYQNGKDGVTRYPMLLGAVAPERMWPTPSASEDKYRLHGFSQQSHSLNGIHGGALNPTWVEWLMGYPLGWTVCAVSATPSCRKSRSGSRAASSPPKG